MTTQSADLNATSSHMISNETMGDLNPKKKEVTPNAKDSKLYNTQ